MNYLSYKTKVAEIQTVGALMQPLGYHTIIIYIIFFSSLEQSIIYIGFETLQGEIIIVEVCSTKLHHV